MSSSFTLHLEEPNRSRTEHISLSMFVTGSRFVVLFVQMVFLLSLSTFAAEEYGTFLRIMQSFCKYHPFFILLQSCDN